jgi:hypothetical protein
MAGVREFLEKPAGKVVAIALVVVALGAVVYVVLTSGGSSAASQVNRLWFVDSQTGKPYQRTPALGERVPVASPSGNTGYPAELCFWTKDGKPKAEPTPVLLNRWVGKPEPTFCPDCGRLVVGRNPPADAGRRPPPTEAEYKANPPRNADE